MFRVIVAAVLLNLSGATLHNVIVVGDKYTEIGTIKQGGYRKFETLMSDSCRILFTLGPKRENWLGTDKISVQDTIKIDDNTTILEYTLDFLE
jgi:hypothetical protein